MTGTPSTSAGRLAGAARGFSRPSTIAGRPSSVRPSPTLITPRRRMNSSAWRVRTSVARGESGRPAGENQPATMAKNPLRSISQPYVECREHVLDAVDDGRSFATREQQADDVAAQVQHCRAAVAALAHGAGQDLVGEACCLAVAIADVDRHIHLFDLP